MIEVIDPFGVSGDPQMLSLAAALDPVQAKKELKRRLPRLSGPGRLRLTAIRVTRYKPQRRCVVEYDVEVRKPDEPAEQLTLIGKVRARRFGNESYRLLHELWTNGFNDSGADRVCVPEPLGVISAFQMWFQRKVPGETATRPLAGPAGSQLAQRVADAAHKIHQANVATDRHHGIADELRILNECFSKLRLVKPEWNARIARLGPACVRLADNIPELPECGIHRDFYSSQVIIGPERLYLIDFDLYCLGDPALDIGNFIGHLTEQAIRETGSESGLSETEQAMENRFVELAGESRRPAVRAYALLTLARLVYLSTQFPDRQGTTEKLLAVCERRLGL